MAAKQVPLDDFQTPEDVVKRWKRTVSVETLANWRSEGKGPVYVKLRHGIVYRLSDIVAYEKMNTITPRGK